MGHQVTLEIPDEMYELLAKTAQAAGRSLDEWILIHLSLSSQQPILSERERETAMAELMAFAGCVNSGDTDAANNERIDKESMNTQTEK